MGYGYDPHGGSRAVELDIPVDFENRGAEAGAVVFADNEAPRGGGGGVFWDVAEPANLDGAVLAGDGGSSNTAGSLLG